MHGKCYTPEYGIWRTMRQRCYAPYSNRYRLYSERGTKVCNYYNSSFQNFFSDVGYRPDKGFSIDRINNKLHYSCGKCEECLKNGWGMNIRWATTEIQNRNKITNKWYELNGKRMIQADWATEFGVSSATLNKYLKKRTIDEAMIYYSKSKRKYILK